MTLLDVFDIVADALNRYRAYYSPAKLPLFVDGLKEDMTRDTFDRRDGAVLQPDGSGNLQIYNGGGAGKSAVTSRLRGKSWKRIGVARALARGVPGTLDLLPQTALTWSADRGATSIRGRVARRPRDVEEEQVVRGRRPDRARSRRPQPGAGEGDAVGPARLGVGALGKAHAEGEMLSLVPRKARPPLRVRRARAVGRRGLSLQAKLPRRPPACRRADLAPADRARVVDVHEVAQRRGCSAGSRGVRVRLAKSGALRIQAKRVRVTKRLVVAFSAGKVGGDAQVRVRRP